MHIIYITTSSKKEAIEITRSLLAEKLIACSNIFENITSVYEWEGKIIEKTEVVIIAKTVKSCVKSIIKHVKSIHSYDCPCVFSIKTKESDSDFTKWVENYIKLPY
jgi:periplasmic divalent cation tolerance protein